MWPRIQGFVFLLLLALTCVACGYRVGRQASRLPADVKVIAVPAFKNQTSWMRLEQRLTTAVMQEFIQRTRYHVVSKPEGADAVLQGTVLTARTAPAIFDPTTGRASVVQVMVTVSVELRDLRTQEILYSNRNYLFQEQYEIIGGPQEDEVFQSQLDSFFDERQPALNRLARDFAATLVSAVVENF